jgi:hypothetical protein
VISSEPPLITQIQRDSWFSVTNEPLVSTNYRRPVLGVAKFVEDLQNRLQTSECE